MSRKDTVGIQIRVPLELRDKIRACAERNEISQNEWCLQVLAYEVGYELSDDE